MEDKKCANRDKTEEYFNINNLLKLKRQMKNLNTKLEQLKGFTSNVSDPSKLEKIQIQIGELNSEYRLLRNTLYVTASEEFKTCVLDGDFCLTGTCIANILDTTTDYVLRKLKTEVDYVHLPLKVINIRKLLDRADEIGVIDNLDTFKSFVYMSKEIFFSKNSFIEFLKNNLYEVGKKSVFSVQISDFVNKTDEDVSYDELEQLVSKFINKYSKSYEYEDSITSEVAKDIVDFKIDLLRSSTLKKYLEEQKKEFLILDFYSSLKIKYNLEDISEIENIEECKEELYKFNNYYHTNPFSFSKYKSVIPIQDIQVNRLVSRMPHVKFHLKTKDNSKPIALFFIKQEGVYSKTNYDGSRGFKIDLDSNIVYLNLDASTNEANLKVALNNYLIENYTGLL